jgi:hypothetical protein
MREIITKKIEKMSVEELKVRLAEYMNADVRLMPSLVAVEVRLTETNAANCRYDVLLIDEDGGETVVKFRDRYSRLVYVYTLLHPQGYQRRMLAAHDYRELCQLYSMLYFRDSVALLNTIAKSGFAHFMAQNIAQSRNFVRQASPLATPFAIDRPQSHNGKVLIPFVAEGGNVIIDPSLFINKSNL